MRKYLTWQNAASVVLTLGAAAMLGGYWHLQQQRMNSLQQQIDRLPDDKDKVALVKDRLALENAVTGSLIQSVGGLLLFVTAYVSLQNLKATQQNVSIAQRNLLVSEEKQVTERFTQAVNQLGNDKIEIRLGGIYALERIAKDSPKDYWVIVELLASFIQERSPLLSSSNNEKPIEQQSTGSNSSGESEEPLKRSITKDVQAALTVIGRRDAKNDPKDTNQRIDLSRTFLRGANLRGAFLGGVDLRGANLRGAFLRGADLRDAFLWGTNFSHGAVLGEVKLNNANLAGANLSGAVLVRAVLAGANLSGADFKGAYLSGADFRGAKGLDSKQIKAADRWEEAIYDKNFRQQLGSPL